jgi:(2S)-methylsuccinyl-CoA dehydrogenase
MSAALELATPAAAPLAVATGATDAALRLRDHAIEAVRALVAPRGRFDPALLDREQRAAHGLAWLEVYARSIEQMRRWAGRLDAQGRLGELETLLLEVALAEYLERIEGGIPLSQTEIVRPRDLGLGEAALRAFRTPEVEELRRRGRTQERLGRLAALIAEGDLGEWGLEDETLELMREQFRRFSDEQVVPHCHGWHERDELIPLPVVEQLAGLGVFGLTVPEAWGGLGLGKQAMCVVTEELSRGYIGVGSLGTRSEIAAELIRLGGTEAQKQKWLPRIASGEVLPTAVFTEPNTGSDLASLTTRAVRDGEVWRVTGAKTWITHAARADLMTILVRTDPAEKGYKGLSMLLAPKPRGTGTEPFPVGGLTGGEIPVLGYRGMKEYTLAFDGFAVPAENLLGGVPGQGFKQLMATFESARIQTAARAVGVARAALELGLRYARERQQFGRPLYAFPRVANKLVMMAVEIMVARQLTLFAAA